jgi:hypothetical protein
VAFDSSAEGGVVVQSAESLLATQVHFRTTLDELLAFVDEDLLGAITSCSNLDLCPLQTPAVMIPHHYATKQLHREKLRQRLEQLHATVVSSQSRLRDIGAMSATSGELDGTDATQSLPDTTSLRAYYKHYTQPEYKTRLTHIMVAFTTIQTMDQRAEDAQKALRRDLQVLFTAAMCNIDTQMMSTFSRVNPELEKLVLNRKETEKVLHDEYERRFALQMEERNTFYRQVTDWITHGSVSSAPVQGAGPRSTDSLISVLHGMLAAMEYGVVDIPDDEDPLVRVLAGAEPNAAERQAAWRRSVSHGDAQEIVRTLRSRLATWQDVLETQRNTKSKYAVLPELFLNLQEWLIAFQRDFLRIIGQKIPKALSDQADGLSAMDVMQNLYKQSADSEVARRRPLAAAASATAAAAAPRPALSTFSQHSFEGRTARLGVNDADDVRSVISDQPAGGSVLGTSRRGPRMSKKPAVASGFDAAATPSAFARPASVARSVVAEDDDNWQAQNRVATVPEQQQTFMGMMDLHPTVKEFFSTSFMNVRDAFSQNQAIQSRTQNRHSDIIGELQAVEQQQSQHTAAMMQNEAMWMRAPQTTTTNTGTTPITPEPPAFSSFVGKLKNLNPFSGQAGPASVRNSMNTVGSTDTAPEDYVATAVESMCRLDRRMAALRDQATSIEAQYAKLKPKLERQHAVLGALNTVIKAMNTFSSARAREWLHLIQKESDLSTAMLKAEEAYVDQYMDHRLRTRVLLRRRVTQVREGLSHYLHKAFRDLGVQHDGYLVVYNQKQEDCEQRIAEARAYIDTNHSALVAIKDVSATLAKMSRDTDMALLTRHRLRYFHYVEDMQRHTMSIISSFSEILQKLFDSTSFDALLQTLDLVCVKDNGVGVAPRARMSTSCDGAAGMPEFEHLSNGCLAAYTWLQPTTFPKSINPLNVFSHVPSVALFAENFIREGGFHTEPAHVQSDAAKVVRTLHAGQK